jgi:hypothetical protein
MYAVSATIVRDHEGWRAVRQLPTFYLDENVQGFTSEEGAERIALALLDPFNQFYSVDVCAIRVSDTKPTTSDLFFQREADAASADDERMLRLAATHAFAESIATANVCGICGSHRDYHTE